MQFTPHGSHVVSLMHPGSLHSPRKRGLQRCASLAGLRASAVSPPRSPTALVQGFPAEPSGIPLCLPAPPSPSRPGPGHPRSPPAAGLQHGPKCEPRREGADTALCLIKGASQA